MIVPKIGFVTCVHPFYDLPAVTTHRDQAVVGLSAAGCEVIRADTPRNSSEAIETSELLKRSRVDLVILFFCTWVSEDITLALATALAGTPLLLWSLPYLDKDVPMPSPISGIVSSGSNIRRLGSPFAHMVGSVTQESLEEAARTAKAASAISRLRRARFGVVGAPCPGMLDVSADEAEMQGRLGVTTVHLELNTLLEAAAVASNTEAAQLAQALLSTVKAVDGIDSHRLTNALRLYLGMKQLVEQYELDAYCVRCWPELREHHRITVCMTHSQLSDAGIPSTCEVDLPALSTAYILNQLAGRPVYSFDVTGYLEPEGAIQFAHCGSAALSLAGDTSRATIRTHMRTGTGATIEFGFPPGPVTLAKLVRPVDGRWRLLACKGAAIETGFESRGSVAHVQPEPSARAFLDLMLNEGIEHHVILAYGDWTRELTQFCQFTEFELLKP